MKPFSMKPFCLSFGLALAAAAPCAAGLDISFTRIVQTGDAVPGSAATYTSLSRATASQGNFAWRGSAPGASGIYARINGADTVIAQTGMAVPGSPDLFSDGHFSLALGKIDGADVAFRAGGWIFAQFEGDSLQPIATTSTINPGTGAPYNNLQQPYISGGEIAFSNATNSSTIYSGGVLSAAVTTSTVLPAPMDGTAALISQSVYSQGTLAMQVFDSSFRQGILTNRGGSFSMVASGYENIPGQTFEFTQFLDPAIHDDNIAFIAWGPNGTGPGGVGSFKGVFLETDSGLETIAETGAPAPGGGVFTDIARGPALFGDTLFFAAGVDGGNGLGGVYAYYEGDLHVIADTNMLLDGKTPTSFDMSQESLFGVDRGVFLANFDDGSQGIYTFVIPTPGALALFTIGALPLTRRRRHAAA